MRALYPGELSLGLARRAALARALAVEPDLLILDEPFVSLDEATARQLRFLLLDIWTERPTTVVMVTHNLEEAMLLADRIVVMSPRPAHVAGTFLVRIPRQARKAQVLSDLLRSFRQKFPDQV
jgi:NitT/TauT family transport system ATP-binding protein